MLLQHKIKDYSRTVKQKKKFFYNTATRFGL
jgi:hypothetical protein